MNYWYKMEVSYHPDYKYMLQVVLKMNLIRSWEEDEQFQAWYWELDYYKTTVQYQQYTR